MAFLSFSEFERLQGCERHERLDSNIEKIQILSLDLAISALNPSRNLKIITRIAFYDEISLKYRHRTHCMTIIGHSSETNLRFTILPRHFSQVVFQSISIDSVVVMENPFPFDSIVLFSFGVGEASSICCFGMAFFFGNFFANYILYSHSFI